jgi:hypothetical protein
MKKLFGFLCALGIVPLSYFIGHAHGEKPVQRSLIVYEWRDDGGYPHMRRVSQQCVVDVMNGDHRYRYCAADGRGFAGELR